VLKDRYSASVVDLATTPCFFDSHAIAPPFNKYTLPEVDFRSDKLPAKSASLYPVMNTLSCKFFDGNEYWIPSSSVPLRYFNTLLRAFQCITMGFIMYLLRTDTLKLISGLVQTAA
jgi:hypothetical protein